MKYLKYNIISIDLNVKFGSKLSFNDAIIHSTSGKDTSLGDLCRKNL